MARGWGAQITLLSYHGLTFPTLARVDFKGLNCVINYDFPQSIVDYIHRIGRTGRAGRHGKAITFFAEQDADQLRSVANVMRRSGCEVPDWMLSLKKLKYVQSGW